MPADDSIVETPSPFMRSAHYASFTPAPMRAEDVPLPPSTGATQIGSPDLAAAKTPCPPASEPSTIEPAVAATPTPAAVAGPRYSEQSLMMDFGSSDGSILLGQAAPLDALVDTPIAKPSAHTQPANRSPLLDRRANCSRSPV